MTQSQGKVTRQPDGLQVRFERVYNHSIEKVWDAITRPDMLKYWFTDIDMDFKPGGKLTIRFRDDAKTISLGEIVSIDKPNRFVWNWETEQAVWELFREGDKKTKVVFTYTRLDEKYAALAPTGFHVLLDRLTAALDGSTVIHPFGTEENDPEFRELLEAYWKSVAQEFPDLLRFKPVVVEKTYKATVDKVWKAITDKAQMKQWYFDLSEFRPEVGFEFSFNGQGHKGEQYVHRCKVTEVVPLKKLVYSWAYEGYEGMSYVSFELFPKAGQTTLRLTHKGLDTFPKDNPDFDSSSFNGGWSELIGKSLAEFLGK